MKLSIFKTLEKQYLDFEGKKIHVIVDDEKALWFKLKNVRDILRIKDSRYIQSEDISLSEYIIQRKDIKTEYVKDFQPNERYINESGFYFLAFSSNTRLSKQFQKWLVEKVIPSIRTYGIYKLKKEHIKEIDSLTVRINELIYENEMLKTDLKKNKYPNGGIVYLIEYNDNGKNIYRI